MRKYVYMAIVLAICIWGINTVTIKASDLNKNEEYMSIDDFEINDSIKTLEKNGYRDLNFRHILDEIMSGNVLDAIKECSNAVSYTHLIDVDIAQAIADKLGMELKVDNMNFDSIIPAITSGKDAIGVAGMTVTDERKKNVDFTDSYATGVQVVIVREDSKITDVKDLTTKGADNTIGVQLGTTGDIYCTSDIQDKGFGKVQQFNKGADAVQALVSGKIDCVCLLYTSIRKNATWILMNL